jgi:hypothetical protein
MHGLNAGGFPVARGRPASRLGRYRSQVDAAHRWESREDGVWSTDDGGKTWKAAAIGGSYAAGSDAVYWWTPNALFLAAPSLRSSTRIARTDDTIVSGTLVKGGMVALVDRPGKAPNVIVVQGTSARTVTLPPGPPNSVARTIDASGSELVVRGVSVPAPTGAQVAVDWSSRDGGQTWTLTPIESAGGSRRS